MFELAVVIVQPIGGVFHRDEPPVAVYVWFPTTVAAVGISIVIRIVAAVVTVLAIGVVRCIRLFVGLLVALNVFNLLLFLVGIVTVLAVLAVLVAVVSVVIVSREIGGVVVQLSRQLTVTD